VLSYGGSSLGSVFRKIAEAEGIRTVQTAIDLGINYIDTSPFYGITTAESILGKALKGIPREKYYLATKAGRYGHDSKDFDFSYDRIIKSAEESMKRLGVGYLDVFQLHDIEYHGGRFIEQALTEGISALQKLKEQSKTRFYGITTYPIEVFRKALARVDVDTILSHNHFSLNDTQLLDLLQLVKEQNLGLINASPLSMGLLTKRFVADWHPATEKHRAVVNRAISFCESEGTCLEKLAVWFSTSNEDIPTTLVSTANPERIKKNVTWIEESLDMQLVEEVQRILQPIFNKDWGFGD
jgi:aryl-alcohol dehydrogenase-like predicted oxidoreductase